MPPLKKSELLEQFMDMTDGRLERTTAQKILKTANYRLEIAFDAFLETDGVSSSTLLKMFDKIRDPSRDPDRNLAEAESTMGYLESMGVSGEKAELFVVLKTVRAPGFGQISRQGYADGWKETKVAATPTAHRQHVRERVAQMATDPAFFKEVYRYAFTAGKDADQKALQLDRAFVFWDMFLGDAKGPLRRHAWRGKGKACEDIDWLALWKRFLTEKWTRSVNRDMWFQTLEFANKSMADTSLSFWSEDAAWPGVIDDFVKWYREGNGKAAETMEVD